MYQYITDKQFLKDMKCLCADIVNQLVQSINNDDLMTVEAHLVGSGAKNLIMQNANESVDLDYNLCVLAVFGISIDDGRKIKEHIQKHFNLILRKFRLGDCKDSTSVLSTPLVHFKEGNQTEFKIDLAILRLAVYEINFMEGIPPKVAVNEAVELAKKYGNDASSNFVNGVLREIIKDREV